MHVQDARDIIMNEPKHICMLPIFCIVLLIEANVIWKVKWESKNTFLTKFVTWDNKYWARRAPHCELPDNREVIFLDDIAVEECRS